MLLRAMRRGCRRGGKGGAKVAFASHSAGSRKAKGWGVLPEVATVESVKPPGALAYNIAFGRG